MAQIVINEVSQNYSYNIGSSPYAQIALPITSAWGPGYFDADTYDSDKESVLEKVVWRSFASNQDGLEAFVSTYRGPGSNYRTFSDYSYHMAMTLLASGYDILTCRVCAGARAQAVFQIEEDMPLVVKAKYPGSFGNSLMVVLRKVKNPLIKTDYWNSIVYIVDASGVKTAVENKIFVFDIENSTDTILHVGEIGSNFIEFGAIPKTLNEDTAFSYDGESLMLSGGSDIVPMKTSEAYDGAYASVKKLSEELSEFKIQKDTYSECVDNAQAHIAKLSADITSYENKIAEENKVDPVDAEKVALLTSKKTAVEKDQQTWSTKLTGYQAKLTEATNSLSQCKSDLSTSRGTLEAESVKMRSGMLSKALSLAKTRYGVDDTESFAPEYVSAIANLDPAVVDNAFCLRLVNQEWVYTNVFDVYDLLKDKLSYKPNRVISPGWDDQDIEFVAGETLPRFSCISPLHVKLMDIAYYSRCATAYLDIPRSLPRSAVYNESNNEDEIGYAQMLARYVPDNAAMDINGSLYQTHSALFAPWSQYKYVGTRKQSPASPSFAALLIQRAMIRNQSNQYEWLLPSNRSHNVKLGKMSYTVPKKLMDVWQRTEGVGVNILTDIPDMGLSLWGNSTLYEVPPSTYQALANLSTRLAVNAIESLAFKCSLSITWKYNNDDAYSAFYAGVTPLLDKMKDAKAIEDFYIRMSSDINGLDQVKANSVIGKIYVNFFGVINDITIDLIALPPGSDLSQYKV